MVSLPSQQYESKAQTSVIWKAKLVNWCISVVCPALRLNQWTCNTRIDDTDSYTGTHTDICYTITIPQLTVDIDDDRAA